MTKLSGAQLRKMFLGTDKEEYLKFEDSTLIPNLNNDLLISTDFGPLVGKNCSDAGKIAVLNAISDIYVRGGTPLFASVIMIIGNDLIGRESSVLFRAMLTACQEAGITITGGNTIVGEQTIIGLTVIGTKGKVTLGKRPCQIGDYLFISKPLGTGISLRAYYDGALEEAAYDEAVSIMLKPNKLGEELLNSKMIHASTDVTGFGLIGTLAEMLDDNQGVEICLSNIPILSSVSKLNAYAYDNEYIQNNIKYAQIRQSVEWEFDTIKKIALADPQTNGPVLLCAEPDFLLSSLSSQFSLIGKITDKNGIILKDEYDLFR